MRRRALLVGTSSVAGMIKSGTEQQATEIILSPQFLGYPTTATMRCVYTKTFLVGSALIFRISLADAHPDSINSKNGANLYLYGIRFMFLSLTRLTF